MLAGASCAGLELRDAIMESVLEGGVEGRRSTRTPSSVQSEPQWQLQLRHRGDLIGIADTI